VGDGRGLARVGQQDKNGSHEECQLGSCSWPGRPRKQKTQTTEIVEEKGKEKGAKPPENGWSACMYDVHVLENVLIPKIKTQGKRNAPRRIPGSAIGTPRKGGVSSWKTVCTVNMWFG